MVQHVPSPASGRDELHAGEMWTSISTIAWLIARTGLDAEAIRPRAGFRAPAWNAGLVVARRQDTRLISHQCSRRSPRSLARV